MNPSSALCYLRNNEQFVCRVLDHLEVSDWKFNLIINQLLGKIFLKKIKCKYCTYCQIFIMD